LINGNITAFEMLKEYLAWAGHWPYLACDFCHLSHGFPVKIS